MDESCGFYESEKRRLISFSKEKYFGSTIPIDLNIEIPTIIGKLFKIIQFSLNFQELWYIIRRKINYNYYKWLPNWIVNLLPIQDEIKKENIFDGINLSGKSNL